MTGFSEKTYAVVGDIQWEGIRVPVPAPPAHSSRFAKCCSSKPRPLQRRILEYLREGGRPSINAISTDLDVWRFSVQRSLQIMKRDGFVKDQWIWFAPSVVPGIKAHTFHITDLGWRELEFLQLLGEPPKTYPLGYCILMCLKDANLVTIGPIAKMTGAPDGQVRRVIKSLHNKGLVDCLYSKTRTSFGHDMITHLYRINDLGRQVLDAGPDMYVMTIRSRTKRRAFWERP
jgi:predicted ArsR family transcriptional regulator